MPLPKNGTVVSRADLGVAVEEYIVDSPNMGFIGGAVMPVFDVAAQAAEYPVIPKEALLSTPETSRAMRGFYNRSDWEFEMGFYATKENGWEEPLDDREVKLYKHLFDAELMAVKRATGIILRTQEKRIADLVFNATNFTANELTNEWDDATNAVPIDDVATGISSVRSAIGLIPDTLIVAWSTFQNLKRSAQIISLLKYTYPGQDINTMGVKEMAHVLGVERLLVGGAVRNSAKKGQDATIANIWSNEYAMLTCTAQSGDPLEPCIGRTFKWTEESGGGDDGTIVEQYRTETNRSDIYRVRHDTDNRLIKSYNSSGTVVSNISSACSYLFSNVTT